MVDNKIGVRQQPKFSIAIQTDKYKQLINSTLGDPERARRFVAAISSSVAVNPALQECDAGSILSAALLGESLNLSPSPQLGQYYMVPFNDKNTGIKRTQFILGYKGYIQLAIRSGQYRKLNVLALKRDELIHYDSLNEEIEVNLIENEVERENAETTGYYAMFEYINGFRKSLYWSKEKMLSHADRYSSAFSNSGYQKLLDGKVPKAELWKYSSFWYKDFDVMACKTMLRQLIGKWGIMSIDMQKAYFNDMAVINTDGTPSYIDNDDVLFGQKQAVTLDDGKEVGESSIEPQGGVGELDEVSLDDL